MNDLKEIYNDFRYNVLKKFKWNDDKTGIPGGEIQSCQIDSLLDSIKIVKPKRIFEIGFNRGASASLILLTDVQQIVSCDPYGSIENAKILKLFFKDRFEYVPTTSNNVANISGLNSYFDMAFIDGDHLYHSVCSDIQICLDLNIEYLLFDDYYNGQNLEIGKQADVKLAINSFGSKLELIKEYTELPGMVLCKNTSYKK